MIACILTLITITASIITTIGLIVTLSTLLMQGPEVIVEISKKKH